jgi:flavin reductase (DIM6/NTAB) family NADH-FMN oxidoreductase RutF
MSPNGAPNAESPGGTESRQSVNGQVAGDPAGESKASISAEIFVGVFRHHPAGVTVITLDSALGPVGFTATSVVSISVEPPLLSFAISSKSSCWPPVERSSSVVINLLTADQHHVARRFSARGIDRFGTPTRWRRLSSGEPILTESAAWLRCRIIERVEAGDHRVVIALATDGCTARGAMPLVYHDGEYSTLGVRLAGSPQQFQTIS